MCGVCVGLRVRCMRCVCVCGVVCVGLRVRYEVCVGGGVKGEVCVGVGVGLRVRYICGTRVESHTDDDGVVGEGSKELCVKFPHALLE